MLELYQTEWCPYSHMVRRRLTELGLDVVLHQVEPDRPQREAMEAAVGTRAIPVLVLDDGTVLGGDASEIVEELDRRFPEGPYTAEHVRRRVEAASFES